MKKICFMFVLISALFIFGLSFADNDSFGVNPPMNEEATARNGSVAQELVERGLIPLDGEGWAKHPIMPAAGYNPDGTADSSPPASVSKPLSPSAPSMPSAPKF